MANVPNSEKLLSLSNLRLARSKWGNVNRTAFEQLKKLSNELHFSVASGDLLLLDSRWYVTHTGLIRVAETRAVNRALRKAYGIGICSVEEIGSLAEPPQASPESKKLPPQPSNGNRSRTVRDQLCQVIRQHQLDPNLVKAYATDFCAVKALRDATREQIEAFVAHLADWAQKDRNALLCQLNSYPNHKEGAA